MRCCGATGRSSISNTLIPAGSGWVLQAAIHVDRFGQIVGYGTKGGQRRSFVLIPPVDLNLRINGIMDEDTNYPRPVEAGRTLPLGFEVMVTSPDLVDRRGGDRQDHRTDRVREAGTRLAPSARNRARRSPAARPCPSNRDRTASGCFIQARTTGPGAITHTATVERRPDRPEPVGQHRHADEHGDQPRRPHRREPGRRGETGARPRHADEPDDLWRSEDPAVEQQPGGRLGAVGLRRARVVQRRPVARVLRDHAAGERGHRRADQRHLRSRHEDRDAPHPPVRARRRGAAARGPCPDRSRRRTTTSAAKASPTTTRPPATPAASTGPTEWTSWPPSMRAADTHIGWTAAGEWLNYTVDVGTAGSYLLQARVASKGPGGTFHVEAKNGNTSGPIAVPDTGGWQSWRTLSAPITLASGLQSLEDPARHQRGRRIGGEPELDSRRTRRVGLDALHGFAPPAARHRAGRAVRSSEARPSPTTTRPPATSAATIGRRTSTSRRRPTPAAATSWAGREPANG